MKYVWSSDDSKCTGARDCGIIEANSDFDAMAKISGIALDWQAFFAEVFEIEVQYGQEITPALQKKAIKWLKRKNGDSLPYYFIKDENGKVIFGG